MVPRLLGGWGKKCPAPNAIPSEQQVEQIQVIKVMCEELTQGKTVATTTQWTRSCVIPAVIENRARVLASLRDRCTRDAYQALRDRALAGLTALYEVFDSIGQLI